MNLRAEIADWPVGYADVAVVGTSGVLDVVDDGKSHPWASVTKILTALTVLDATVEGVVDLADEVGPPGATLRHLLSHTSGLALDEDLVIARPATRRSYSNRGIDLAAEHLAGRTGTPFIQELSDRVLTLLSMDGTELQGDPAHGARGPITDLATLALELLNPTLLLPQVVSLASTVAFPGLPGILPGFGRQSDNAWGLGCEIRAEKSPHWTAPENSPRTFGHFGQAGTFLWVDPDAQLACVSVSDTPFGPWAADRWPRLSAAVLKEYAG
jgi:CubicO group peptidase (beta-lactamase class C family)